MFRFAYRKDLFFCFFANEPLDSDFRFFAALAGVACEHKHYSKLHFKIVDLCTGEELGFDLRTGDLCFDLRSICVPFFLFHCR